MHRAKVYYAPDQLRGEAVGEALVDGAMDMGPVCTGPPTTRKFRQQSSDVALT